MLYCVGLDAVEQVLILDYENTPFAPTPRGLLGRTVISLNRTTDQNIEERMKDFLFPIQEKLHICSIV